MANTPTTPFFVTASADRSAKIWSTITGTVVHNLVGHGEEVTACAFSHDGQFVATGGGLTDKSVIVWDATTGLQVARYFDHPGGGNYVPFLAFSPDGTLLSSAGSNDELIVIRETATWQPVTSLAGYHHVFSADSARLAVSRSDMTVRIHQVSDSSLVASIPNPLGAFPIDPSAFTPGGDLLTTASDGTGAVMVLFDSTTGAEGCRQANGGGAPSFRPDGLRFVSSDNLVAHIWNAPAVASGVFDSALYE